LPWRSHAPVFGGGNLSRGEGEDRANRWVIVPLLIGLHDAPTQLELFENRSTPLRARYR